MTTFIQPTLGFDEHLNTEHMKTIKQGSYEEEVLEKVTLIARNYDHVNVISESWKKYPCCAIDSYWADIVSEIRITYWNEIEVASTETDPNGDPFIDVIKGETQTEIFTNMTATLAAKVHEILEFENIYW